MPYSVHSTPGTVTPTAKRLDYWNVNVPESEWTRNCPEWLLTVDGRDREILETNDADYKRQSWARVQEIVSTNRLDLFERVPTDLRRYLHYIYDLKRTYGSVLSFIQHERLHWDSVTPSSAPHFTNPDDYKILWNDWPYGLEPGISHLVVWTKFLLEEDPSTGDLTDRARAEIEAFVVETFCNQGGFPRERLVWFKNWKALKSVHAIEHFHVMLYEAPKERLHRITDGTRPISETITRDLELTSEEIADAKNVGQ